MKRKIIKIDHEKCNGCGLCIPNCPEGAIQMIDGKARLMSDLLCDGLGACLGHCPEGVTEVEEREAEAHDERRVMAQSSPRGGTPSAPTSNTSRIRARVNISTRRWRCCRG